TNDCRGVEPPGQTHADGNVAPQADSHGVFEQLRQYPFDIPRRLLVDGRERPVGPLSPVAIEPELERARRRDLLDTSVERRRSLIQLPLDQKVDGDLPVRRACIDPRPYDGLDLGREEPAVLALVHEERLHAEAVPRAEEHAAA